MDPCPGDEEFFTSGPDPAVMEEAIMKFMDGMEAREHCGFKDLRCRADFLDACLYQLSRNDTH